MFSTLDIKDSCFFGRDKAAIQESLAPVQLALLVWDPQEGEPEIFPYSLELPFLETAIAGGRGSIPSGEVPPSGAGAQHPENTIDGFPVVGSRPASLLGQWEQWSNQLPLVVS
jgi:hypothetical protein